MLLYRFDFHRMKNIMSFNKGLNMSYVMLTSAKCIKICFQNLLCLYIKRIYSSQCIFKADKTFHNDVKEKMHFKGIDLNGTFIQKYVLMEELNLNNNSQIIVHNYYCRAFYDNSIVSQLLP